MLNNKPVKFINSTGTVQSITAVAVAILLISFCEYDVSCVFTWKSLHIIFELYSAEQSGNQGINFLGFKFKSDCLKLKIFLANV